MDNDGGQRPDFIRRHVRRGWWWFGGIAAVAGLFVWGDVEGTRALDDRRASGFPVEATVGDDYAGGEPIPLRYDHPTFGGMDVDAYTYTLDPEVEAGQTIPVVADRIDPQNVEFPGDEYDRAPLWFYPALLAVGVVPMLVRRSRVRRTPRAAASGTQPYLGRIRHRAWPHRGLAVDLYPTGAVEGTKPVASVPLISSGGLPVQGEAFPVLVAGTPGPLRQVDIRTTAEVLWTSRRALALRLGGRRAFGGAVGEVAPPAPPQSLPPGRPIRGTRLRLLLPLAVAGLGALAFLATAAVVIPGYLDAEDFERDGLEVPAEVTGIEEGSDELAIEYRPDGQDRRVQATVGVDFPEDWEVGDKTLAVVDPDDPTDVRLLANSYDATTPLLLVGLAAVPGILWLAWEVRFGRRLRRRREGPWYAADILDSADVTSLRPPFREGLRLEIARPGAKVPSATVVVSGFQAKAALRERPGRTVPDPDGVPVFGAEYRGPILVAGALSPGEAVVLRAGDKILPTSAPAKAPKRDQTWAIPDGPLVERPSQPLILDVLDALDGR